MINAFCPFFGPWSYAQHARGFLRALNRLHPVALIPSRWPEDAVDDEVGLMLERGTTPDLRQPGLSIGDFEQTTRVAGAWRIGFVVWETTRLDPRQVRMLRALDEVWTPSSWGRRVLIDNAIDEERVHVVPEGVDPELFQPIPRPRTEERPFRFLCIARWSIRKGVDELLRAFCDEFAPSEEVELVLHCGNPGRTRDQLDARVAKAAAGPHAPIVASTRLPGHEMAELYRRCDAFVLATRGEGWGLPIVEAMACGLPVIATDYSAQSDYLDDAIAYPLRVEKLIDVCDPSFGPNAGQWAQPDIAHLRSLMRYVFEHRNEARAKGSCAAEVVRRDWTWHRAAEKAYELLKKRIGA